MSRFTRIERVSPGLKVRDNRVFGEKVALGEPLQLQTGQDLREQIENSLEEIAKQRLLEAEREARAREQEILDAARAQAKEILEKANAQAKELLQTAQMQEQAIRDAAQESGFKSGFEEGYSEATAQVEQETLQLLESARLVVETAYQAEQKVLKDFEKHAVALLRHLARTILRRELSDSPESLLHMVQSACEALYLSGRVRVVIHPQILHEIRNFSARTAEGLDALHRFEFMADPALELHQVYIIGQDGNFELTPDVQVECLLEPLQEHLTLPRLEVKNSRAESSVEETLAEPKDSPLAQQDNG
ncbi:MAG TPA: FliH/SctL family protein, partial [Oculatellaceae cyanobacterium]